AFPAGTTMNLVEASRHGSDHSPQGELMDRADRYARLLILGQTMSGSQSASRGGGKAFGVVESEVKATRVEAAGQYVCGVLKQLVRSILILNYGDADLAPEPFMLRDEKAGVQEAQRDETLASAGLRIGVNYLRAKYDIPEPGEGEEVIGGKDEEEDATRVLKGRILELQREFSGDDAGFAQALTALLEQHS
ncbi:MAG: DUF935 family protein, partial [Candidatus Acidoferrales bacterium]|nr:DUF935 family protein [Candidatus Acidoferrales bacterium]